MSAIEELQKAKRLLQLEQSGHTDIVPLDQEYEYTVSYDHDTDVWIEGENANTVDMEYTVVLTPAQALSLLEWLECEKSTLKRLAKEKAG